MSESDARSPRLRHHLLEVEQEHERIKREKVALKEELELFKRRASQ